MPQIDDKKEEELRTLVNGLRNVHEQANELGKDVKAIVQRIFPEYRGKFDEIYQLSDFYDVYAKNLTPLINSVNTLNRWLDQKPPGWPALCINELKTISAWKTDNSLTPPRGKSIHSPDYSGVTRINGIREAVDILLAYIQVHANRFSDKEELDDFHIKVARFRETLNTITKKSGLCDQAKALLTEIDRPIGLKKA